MKKEERGITLIALVITIIVLLILAGVVIQMSTGNNGILKQAAEVKEKTDTKSVEEQINLATAASIINEEHRVNIKDLKEELGKYNLELDKDCKDSETEQWTVTKDGITYVIDKKGHVTISIIPVSDYGASIDYVAPGDDETKWRIFFADSSNVYIITKDYILKDKFPETKEGNKPEDGSYENTGKLSNVATDYSKWYDMIKGNSIKDSLSVYHKWANSHGTSNSPNIKSVAYMLDTDIWKTNYVDEKYASYAIGGPTIEMFSIAYNAKKHTNEKGNIEISTKKNLGYQVKWENDENYNDYINGLSEDEYNYLFVLDGSGNRAQGYWLASPSNKATGAIMRVNCNGQVYINVYDRDAYGFRPVVCLKSEVKLEKQSDGTYQIK